MNNKDLITVIVPVFNVEKYLEKCIESIINQTYKNLEILLIDDGSTDGSPKICDEYSKKDTRIRVIHKENGGLSDARNVGIETSNGEFIAFIDSDDYIETEMIENLYLGCIENDVDMAWCDKIREEENGKSFVEGFGEVSSKLSQKRAFESILVYSPSVCDKIFKKELFIDVRFPKGKLYEDTITINKIIDKCENIYYVKGAYYHYVQRNNSIVHKKFNIKKMDYLKNAQELCDFIMKRYPDLEKQCTSYYILVLCTIICDMYPERKEFINEYNNTINELKKYRSKILSNMYIPKLKKIMALFISFRLVGVAIIAKKIKDFIKYR